MMIKSLSKAFFILALAMILVGGLSSITNHSGFANLVLSLSFAVLLIGELSYIWEIMNG